MELFTLVGDLFKSTSACAGMKQRYVSCCEDRSGSELWDLFVILAVKSHREKRCSRSEYRDTCVIRVTVHQHCSPNLSSTH